MKGWRREAGYYHAWKKFVTVCRSLTADGFDFQVTLKSDGRDIIQIHIEGTAGRAAKHQETHRRVLAMPAKVSPEKCAKMAAESLRAAVPLPSGRPSRYWDAERRRNNRRIGRLIAKAKARGESILDWNVIHPMSGAPGLTYPISRLIEETRRKAWWKDDTPETSLAETRAARLEALAEYQYWREMEILSGQRQHFKPGLNAETDTSDDEVAA
jgi:hypothetical protein